MSDVPRPMLAGSLALTGKVPVVLAQGVTFPLAAGTINAGFKLSNKGMAAYPLSHTFTVPELQLNVITAFGYLPYGVRVVGFSVTSADLDSGGSALVQSIYVGDTQVATGVVTGAAGTSAFYACAPPQDLSAPTTLYMKVTTAATTVAAGAVTIYSYYYSL